MGARYSTATYLVLGGKAMQGVEFPENAVVSLDGWVLPPLTTPGLFGQKGHAFRLGRGIWKTETSKWWTWRRNPGGR